jgi:uncharacterized protein YndB with AHSA1/START domain
MNVATLRGRHVRAFHNLAAGAALALALILCDRASADVTDVAPGKFTIVETVHIAAAGDRVYAALIAPQRWWSSEHTFSGSAANMSLDARAGGCWCETLPGGGSVLHMTVVYAVPGKGLHLRGSLGPFQTMAAEGAMVWSLAPKNDGTDVTMTYAVAGYLKDGFGNISHGADGVLAEQLARLKHTVETGSPESPKENTP